MRLMWLWVLLYAIVLGLILLILGLFAESGPEGGVTGIRVIVGLVSVVAALGGLVVGIMGGIFLARGTVAQGKAVSLFGIWLYYIAAFGIILASFMSENSSFGTPTVEIVVLTIFVAVFVGLPGFFLMRTLQRAQKAEKGET
jgi:hypothetical protein